MDEEMKFYVALGLSFALLILIRVLAGTDNILGKICRWYWNTCFKIAAYIPFCGWMAHFIIGKEKETYIRIGAEADALGYGMVSAAADRERAQQRRDEAIRKKLAEKGLTAVSINSDGTFVTAKDKRGNDYNVEVRYEK